MPAREQFLAGGLCAMLREEFLTWIPFACTLLLPAPTPLCICPSGRLQRLQKHIQIPRFSDELEHAIYSWTRQTLCQVVLSRGHSCLVFSLFYVDGWAAVAFHRLCSLEHLRDRNLMYCT